MIQMYRLHVKHCPGSSTCAAFLVEYWGVENITCISHQLQK